MEAPHIATQIIPLRQLPEDIIAAASLGIPSVKSVLTGHVPEAIRGTDQNAYPSLPLVILPLVIPEVPEVAAIIIIPPTLINPVVDPDTIGMAMVAFAQVLLILTVLVRA